MTTLALIIFVACSATASAALKLTRVERAVLLCETGLNWRHHSATADGVEGEARSGQAEVHWPTDSRLVAAGRLLSPTDCYVCGVGVGARGWHREGRAWCPAHRPLWSRS